MNQTRAEALADASAFFIGASGRRRQFLLPAASLLLLAIAISQPRWGLERKASSRPADVVWFVVDVGSTMRCRDLPGGRGGFAKTVAGIVAGTWNGKFRLSVFDEVARLISPATSDLRRTQRMIERLTFDDVNGSSIQGAVEHIEGEPLSEAFLGVVFTDGGGEMNLKRFSRTTNGRWIVVGLGDAVNPTPVPAPDGGWLFDKGVPVVSKRNDAAIERLAGSLNASLLPAWPDADAVGDRIIQQSRSVFGGSESTEVVPREQFQWFAAAALMLLLQPWKWRLGVKPMMFLLGLFMAVGSAFGSEGDYRSARSELEAGRWAEARRKFEELTRSQDFLGWAQWGSGCAEASLANETDDQTRRQELVASAIRSFREAAISLSDPTERTAVLGNINIAKRMLEEPAAKSPTESPSNPNLVKRTDPGHGASSSVAEANPKVDRKVGTEIGGGGVERPVAGLNVADPGPLSRNQSEAVLDEVVRKAELTEPNRAGARAKQ
jgi:hypothetical protein